LIFDCFWKIRWKFKVHYNRTKITGTLHDDQYAFVLYFAQLFLEWQMFRTNFVEKIKTHFMFNNFFFSKILSFMR
jgi:hypothetical protein